MEPPQLLDKTKTITNTNQTSNLIRAQTSNTTLKFSLCGSQWLSQSKLALLWMFEWIGRLFDWLLNSTRCIGLFMVSRCPSAWGTIAQLQCGTTRSINTYSNNNNKSVTRRVKFHVTVWRYYCNNYIAYTYSGSKLSSYNCRKYVDRMRSNRNIGAWTRAALESPKIDTDSHVRNTEFPFDYIVSTRLKLKEMMATI